jgi:hypothetical protein
VGPVGGPTPRLAEPLANSTKRVKNDGPPSAAPNWQWGDVNGPTGAGSPESLRPPKPVPNRTGSRTPPRWPRHSTAGSPPRSAASPNLRAWLPSTADGSPNTPTLARHVKHVQRQLQRLDDPINAELLDRLDALGRDDPPVGTRAQEQDDITKVRQRLDRLQRTHTIEPPGLAL